MATKGENTRARILDAAAQLFTEKGYSSVTMKDVCEATGLSRGGLYRNFGSTAEMMIRLMEQEQQHADINMENVRSKGTGAEAMLEGFLQYHYSFMMSSRGRLELAMNQFALTSEEGRQAYDKRVKMAVRRLSNMICQGQQEGVFRQQDAEMTAWNVMMLIGGMRIHAVLEGFESEFIKRQLLSIKDYIIEIK